MSKNRVKNYSSFNKSIFFYFDNKKLHGYEGETLASALIANGVKLVGRSFKYHRPRGIMALGTEEPNALITIQKGNHFYFRRLNEEDNKIPCKGSLKDFYDRVRMLDDSTYPNAFVEYGDYIIEFNKAEFTDGQINCVAQIKFNSN